MPVDLYTTYLLQMRLEQSMAATKDENNLSFLYIILIFKDIKDFRTRIQLLLCIFI